MSRPIHNIIPDPEVLLSLEPEEIGGVVLEYLNSLTQGESGQLNRYNFSLPHTVQGYPRQYQDAISKVLMEGWSWLEREGLIAMKPGSQGEWVFITRRGQQLQSQENFESFRNQDILPRGQLHPKIMQVARPSFIRGEYDTAVFKAFREIEISIREAGNFTSRDIGTSLMRKAFDVNTGSLTDPNQDPAEKQALSDLFAGAIGSYKNPHSHRDVPLEPEEAAEMVIIASHLMKVVDARRPE